MVTYVINGSYHCLDSFSNHLILQSGKGLFHMSAKKGTNLSIRLNDGSEHQVNVDAYNAQDLAAKLNDNSETLIAFGDLITHKGYITRINVVEDKAEPEK